MWLSESEWKNILEETEWVSQVFHVWQGSGQSFALDSWAEIAVRVIEVVGHDKPVAHPT